MAKNNLDLVLKINELTIEWAKETKLIEELNDQIDQRKTLITRMEIDWNDFKKKIKEMRKEFYDKYKVLLQQEMTTLLRKPTNISNIGNDTNLRGQELEDDNTISKEMEMDRVENRVSIKRRKLDFLHIALSTQTGSVAAVCSDGSWKFFESKSSIECKIIEGRGICTGLASWKLPKTRIKTSGKGFVFLNEGPKVTVVDAKTFLVIEDQEFDTLNEMLKTDENKEYNGGFIITDGFDSPDGIEKQNICYLIYSNGIFLFYHPQRVQCFIVARPSKNLDQMLQKHTVVGGCAITENEFAVWTTFENKSYSSICSTCQEGEDSFIVFPVTSKDMLLIGMELPRGEIIDIGGLNTGFVHMTVDSKLNVMHNPLNYHFQVDGAYIKTLADECKMENSLIYTFCYLFEWIIIIAKSQPQTEKFISVKLIPCGETRVADPESLQMDIKYSHIINKKVLATFDENRKLVAFSNENGKLEWLSFSK